MPTNWCPQAAFPELYQQGNWILNLVTGKVNVLNLTEKQVEDMTSVNGFGSVDATTTLVVNITDHGVVDLPTRYWSQIQNGRSASISSELPEREQGDRRRRASTWPLFASPADVTLASAQVKGDVVAATLIDDRRRDGRGRSSPDRPVPCIGG